MTTHDKERIMETPTLFRGDPGTPSLHHDGRVVHYFSVLFSPETYAAFTKSPQTIMGVPLRQFYTAMRVAPHDVLVCYVAGYSRWCGLLEVLEGPFIDETPVFTPAPDRFVVRFRVEPLVWCADIEEALPIKDEALWRQLSFTRDRNPHGRWMGGRLRQSLARLHDSDGDLLANALMAQAAHPRQYPVEDVRMAPRRTARTPCEEAVEDVPLPVMEEDDEALLETPDVAPERRRYREMLASYLAAQKHLTDLAEQILAAYEEDRGAA
jgi:hypothetical protein